MKGKSKIKGSVEMTHGPVQRAKYLVSSLISSEGPELISL